MNGLPALLSAATVESGREFSGRHTSRRYTSRRHTSRKGTRCLHPVVQVVANIEASARGVMKLFFRVAREGTR